jgi:hypothetical protein
MNTIKRAVRDKHHWIELKDSNREFIRFSKSCWIERYGESWESVYDTEELEAAFQNYLDENYGLCDLK